MPANWATCGKMLSTTPRRSASAWSSHALACCRSECRRISLVNIDRIPTDRAGFGSTLHVVEKTGDRLVFQLVTPEDADAEKGLISTTSPIGRAFLNREEGDSIKVMTPGGTREFEILRLLTIHDEAAAASGDKFDDRAV